MMRRHQLDGVQRHYQDVSIINHQSSVISHQTPDDDELRRPSTTERESHRFLEFYREG